jgi:hypothetical protein
VKVAAAKSEIAMFTRKHAAMPMQQHNAPIETTTGVTELSEENFGRVLSLFNAPSLLQASS